MVSYNRFVELEKEIGISLALFIKKVLLGKCTGISFVDSTPCVFAVTKEYTSTRHGCNIEMDFNLYICVLEHKLMFN